MMLEPSTVVMCVLVIWYMYVLHYMESCGVTFVEYLGTYYRLWCCVCSCQVGLEAHVRRDWTLEQVRLT